VTLYIRNIFISILVSIPRSLRAWVIPLAILTIWIINDYFRTESSATSVSVYSVIQRFTSLIASGELWLALQGSLIRLIQGLLLGVVIGFLFGTLLGMSRFADKLLGPSFNTVKQISLFAWIPLMSIWFGMGDTGKIVFLAMAAFFPMAVNAYEGIRSVPRDLLDLARSIKLRTRQVILLIVIPSAMPSLFNGLYLAMIYAWLASIGAEYLLSSSPGIGTLLVDGQEHFLMDQVIVGLIVIGFVGFILNTGASRIERKLLSWRVPSTASY